MANPKGIAGHHVVCHSPGDWRCSCGASLSSRRREAREAQRIHLRDLRLAAAMPVMIGGMKISYVPDMTSLRERVLSRLVIDPQTGCLLWTGSLTGTGYGKVSINDQDLLVHRVMYEWFVGPVPDGLELDHVKARGCRYLHCASPAHLEPVTGLENKLRADGIIAANAAKTHCDSGHEFTDANIYWNKGKRDCRTCRRDASQRSAARKKATR